MPIYWEMEFLVKTLRIYMITLPITKSHKEKEKENNEISDSEKPESYPIIHSMSSA